MAIVIIGAGITGLTCAWKLSELYGKKIILIEKEEAVGGLIRTIHKDGLSFDLGSHRIHPLFPSDIFKTMSSLCDNDLLKRKRNGLLFSNKNFIKYPPTIPNILMGFGLRDFLMFGLDYVIKFPNRLKKADIDILSYESYMISMVGKGIYERLFKPYALKLWGIDPATVAPNPAVSRNGHLELPMFLKELLQKIRKGHIDYYFYPKRGMGVLAENLKKEFLAKGGQLFLNAEITEIKTNGHQQLDSLVISDSRGDRREIKLDILISTIGQDDLLDMIKTSDCQQDMSIRKKMFYRSLRVIYMETGDILPYRNEAFYFPEPAYLIGRVSELNKYSPDLNNLKASTILTVEVPATEDDAIWNMSDEKLFNLCKKDLMAVNILKRETKNTRLRYAHRLKNVYPVYTLNYRNLFRKKYDYLNTFKNLFLVGRNALFLHCNMDHCMHMAFELSQVLSMMDNEKDRKEKWLKKSEDFFSFRLRY